MIDLIIGLTALGFMTVVFFIGAFTIAGEEQEEQHDHLHKNHPGSIAGGVYHLGSAHNVKEENNET